MKALALLLSLTLVGVGAAQTVSPPIAPVRGALDDRTTAVPAVHFRASDETAVDAGFAAAGSQSGRAPIATIDGGRVRGMAVPEGYVFRGLPYGAPLTERLRWRAPRPPAEWRGVRDATVFAPSCPQPQGFTIGPQDEDCLYLNVTTPRLNDHRHERARHVARAAATTGQKGFRIETPLFVLGRPVTILRHRTRSRSTTSLWEEHMANPILVTGAAGRVGAIGRTVSEVLLKHGKAVRAMVGTEDERAQGLRDMGEEVVVGDLLDLGSMHRAIAGCETMYFGMSVTFDSKSEAI